jgi:uncharacterized protein with HEPN domain
MRNDRERLLDILQAITQIEKYAARGKGVFERDELIQNWIVNRLQIIGEASRALTPAFRNENPEIAWSDIIGMRNILVHDYFGVDTDIVWTVVENSLPTLKQQVNTILQKRGSEQDNGT